ncbi:MAG: Ig-like domain-containing protein [Pseudomonadota bacterium]
MLDNKTLRLSLLLVGTGALAACGGSSGSDPAPVAGTPAPAPAPAPAPVAETITITGFVTDMPIANATVEITVDGQTFTAPNPTGTDGSYTVDIESTDPEALVLCEAFDPNGPVRFTALLNNFAGLQGSAGDDGVAEDLNITNLTTAQFLLAQEEAADGSIDDIEELQDLAQQIDPQAMLEVAAAIKVVVDSVQGITLPDGFEDVQELAQAIIDEATSFIEDIETLSPGILDEAIGEVVTDGFATGVFTEAEVPGAYVDDAEGDIAVFFADGTGYFAETEEFQTDFGTLEEEQIVEQITWTVTSGGQLEIVFVETQDIDTVTLLNEAGGVLTLYSNEFEADSGEQDISTFTVVRYGFDADGFDAATVPGSYREVESDEEDDMEFKVFLADGSGYDIDVETGVQDDFFTWSVNDDNELELTDDGIADSDDDVGDDGREVVTLLEGSTADTLLILSMEMELEGDAVIGLEAFAVSYTEEIFTGPEADMANTLQLEGKSYAFFDGDERGIVTFGTDGVFSEIIQDFDDQDGPEFEEGEGEWFIDADGAIFLTFVEDNGEIDNDQATVVSGLGEATMTVSVVDDDGVVDEFSLTQVVAFTEEEVVGMWQLNADGATSEDIVDFAADGSGTYSENGQLEDTFEWGVDANGILVIALDDGTQEVFTDNFHKLADSTDDLLHVANVYRRDGELENDADDQTGPPEVIVEEFLTRLSDGT